MSEFCPVVSVTMTAYNHGKYIRQAVESVFAQKTNFDFEVIVGEDCSPAPDKSREILLELKEKYGERLVLLLHEKNLGPRGNSRAIKEKVRGKYIAHLECDDYWTDPNKLQRQYDFLEAHPEYSACGADSCLIDDDGETLWKNTLGLRKDNAFTMRDYKVKGFTVHGNVLMRRASIMSVHDEKVKKLLNTGTTMGDIYTFSLLYSYGPIYVFKEVMHAHRAGDQVASSFSESSKKRMIEYSYMQMDIAKALEEYFDHKKDFSFIVVNRLAEVMVTYLFFRKGYALTWKEIGKLFRANPLSVRLRALWRTAYRIIHRGLGKIKRKLLRLQ